MSEWMSVEDRLPDDGDKILVYNGDCITACTVDRDDSRDWLWMDGLCFGGYEWEYDFEWGSVTHWMSLPEPPELLSDENLRD